MQENAVDSPTLPADLESWCSARLQALGDKFVRAEPLRVEASHRLFYRIFTDGHPQILMASPPQLENNTRFVHLDEVFLRHNVPVPLIRAQNPAQGWFLLEDLGDTHLEDVYDSPLEATALKAAVELLAVIGEVQDPAIELYDAQRLHQELQIFHEWFARQWLQLTPTADDMTTIDQQLVAAMEAQPKSCVHRDYHCRNLLYHNSRLGVVDFQDALHGPMLYDIASLLGDCYYRFSTDTVDFWLNHFIRNNPRLADLPAETVRRWFDWTTIQRQLKAVGIFARLSLRDGRATHLRYILPVLQQVLATTIKYPELAMLYDHVAEAIERVPARLAAG